MKTVVGIPIWEERVAATLDFASQLLVVNLNGRCETGHQEISLHEGEAMVALVERAGIDILICGAVSRIVWELLTRQGIQVIPFVSGDLTDVLGAWLCGRLDHPRFRQPGCRAGARRRWRGSRGCWREKIETKRKSIRNKELIT